MPGAFKPGRRIACLRDQRDGPRRLEAGRSVAPVPMQAAEALEQHIHRREIGDQEVRIQIQAHLERRRPERDDRPALAAATLLGA
nr:hypothetical protein [Methylobacterium terrae]